MDANKIPLTPELLSLHNTLAKRAQGYINQSRERAATKHAETRRLQAIWTDAYRLWLAQPTADNKALAAEAHTAYKAGQGRTLSTTI